MLNSSNSTSLIALIPATGRSRRMGQPKLLLKLGGQTVIEHLVSRLGHPDIARIAISCRAEDTALRTVLERLPVTIVTPDTPPPEMRESVAALLTHMTPHHTGGWLLIPADAPVLESQVLERLLQAWHNNPKRMVVPIHQGQRGHPTLFPASWPMEIERIPAECGINWLLRSQPQRVLEVECPEPSVLYDLDTPADWERLQAVWSH